MHNSCKKYLTIRFSGTTYFAISILKAATVAITGNASTRKANSKLYCTTSPEKSNEVNIEITQLQKHANSIVKNDMMIVYLKNFCWLGSSFYFLRLLVFTQFLFLNTPQKLPGELY
jgi:hypothetical protein